MSRSEQLEAMRSAFVDAFWDAIPPREDGDAAQRKFVLEELEHHLQALLDRFIARGEERLASPHAVQPVAAALAGLKFVGERSRR